jgi:hypothetical protein
MGMRGHLYALNAATGAVVWSFATTAGPGDPGSGTWTGNSWELGGGDAWIPPAIEPRLGLIYLTVANPEPRTGGGTRAGNDLYTSSLVALSARTGKLVIPVHEEKVPQLPSQATSATQPVPEGQQCEGPLRGVLLRPDELHYRVTDPRPVEQLSLHQARRLLLQRLRRIPLEHRRDNRPVIDVSAGC